mmetsp:Transcript_21990/g.43635  ORF Transcript_21990/g.43635 Transcript_21990/m.43635 type:complete len:279 (-) Transcript_21990:876-1712(-)
MHRHIVCLINAQGTFQEASFTLGRKEGRKISRIWGISSDQPDSSFLWKNTAVLCFPPLSFPASFTLVIDLSSSAFPFVIKHSSQSFSQSVGLTDGTHRFLFLFSQTVKQLSCCISSSQPRPAPPSEHRLDCPRIHQETRTQERQSKEDIRSDKKEEQGATHTHTHWRRRRGRKRTKEGERRPKAPKSTQRLRNESHRNGEETRKEEKEGDGKTETMNVAERIERATSTPTVNTLREGTVSSSIRTLLQKRKVSAWTNKQSTHTHQWTKQSCKYRYIDR